jgi:hypothetical protein
MIPVITKSQFKWRNPVTGTVFNKSDKSGVSETNGVSLGKSIVEKARLPFINDAIKHKEKLESQGKEWPAKASKVVTDKEVESEWGKVKGSLWYKGGNTQDTSRERNELEVVYRILDGDKVSPTVKTLRDTKEKEIVRSWLEHDKKSPVTGKPLELPVKDGKVTTIDHVKPYDKWREENPKLDPVSLSRLADRAGNYYIVEAAPNNWKGSLPSWSAWLARDKDKNMAHLKTHLDRKVREAPPVVTLTRQQFKERFPTLNYDNPGDLEKAARLSNKNLQGRLLMR